MSKWNNIQWKKWIKSNAMKEMSKWNQYANSYEYLNGACGFEQTDKHVSIIVVYKGIWIN